MRRLTVNALDPSSIKDVIKQLEDYEQECADIADDVLREVVKEAVDIAQKTYDGNPMLVPWRTDYQVDVRYHKTDDGYVITADGEELCFIEFGSGIFAEARRDPVAQGAKAQGVIIFPGAWSATHAQTFQKWEAGGRKGQYQFNGRPSPGMLRAYEAIRDKLPAALEKRFKEFK